jgi:hypothetical protein
VPILICTAITVCDLGHIATCHRGQQGEVIMNASEFRATLKLEDPPKYLGAPLAALWWDAKGNWAQAHGLVDELETIDGMAVHAYLHRKEGAASNAEYWYARAGRKFQRSTLEAEWEALVIGLLPSS